MPKYNNFDTQAIHEGYEPDHTRSRAIPLHRTTSYVFDSPEQASNIFELKEFGNIYSRVTNPTIEILEERVSILEGGKKSVSFSSGTAAIYASILNLAKCGDEIISASTIYGGTHTMFVETLAESGIYVHLVDPFRVDSFKEKINENTRAIFIESIGNPALVVLDIEAIATLAHENGLPLIVDATFSTPYVMRTINFGADIVVNSLTKWMAGHGTVLGGSITDAGTFQWADNKRFPFFNMPMPGYENKRWAHDFGEYNDIAYALRLQQVVLRNTGACLSADNAWHILQGIESLGVRMERHCSNAQKAAEFLAGQAQVEFVNYPNLPCDPSYDNAQRYCTKGIYGGMLVVNLKGGRKAGEEFISALQMFSHLANVGDTKSLAIHPASTTHSLLNDEEQIKAGVNPGAIRLSVGIEDIEDIIADLTRGLNNITN